MNKKYLVPVATLSVIAVCVASLFFAGAATEKKEHEIEAVGGDEEGEGRGNYELMQLRDPATGKIPSHIREKELAFASGLPNDIFASGAYGKTTASSLVWQPRGPWNVGGRTRAFAIDAANENNLLAGTVSGGMWRSTDGGSSWAVTTPINAYMNVSCITQDRRPGHTNIWYYGSGEASGASASAGGAYYLGNGVFKSTDSGVTWNVLASTTSALVSGFDTWADLLWNIVADSSNATQDVVYAAAYGGIHRTIDGGTTWTSVLGTFGASSDCYYTDVAVSKSGIVYATLSSDGPSRGLYRSTDGVTFTNITPSTFPTTYNRIKIAISPADENQVYFLGNTPGFGQPDTNYVGTIEWNSLWKYNYLSGDGSGTGGAWDDRSRNLPNSGGPFDKFMTQGSYDIVIKVKPNDTNTVFIGGTNVYRSTSGFADTAHTTYIGGYQQGATLPIVNGYANHHPDQHEIVFYPSNPNKMISTNDGGIFRTTNNTASPLVWNSLNNGYISSMFYTCAIDHASTNDILIGGAQDNGSWYTNNTTLTSPWVTPRGGDGSYCAIADNSSAFYFSIQQGKMMKARLNASGAIDSFARIDPIGGSGYQFVNPFTLDPNNTDMMYLIAGRALWRNNSLSGIPYLSNWDTISTNWVKFPDSLSGGTYTAVAVSTTPANRVYLGTSSRRVYKVDNSNTGTPAKVEITSTTVNNTFPSGGNVSCIAVDPSNADNVMVVFSNYNVYSLYFSRNGGTSWAKIGGNLEPNIAGNGNGPSLRWAKIIPVTGGTVYLVGTSTGLYATTEIDSVNTVWTQQATTTIGSSVVDMIDYRATDGLVVIATHGHGMFSTHITHVADVNTVKQITAVTPSFELKNYPNPFTNQTTISFNLPAAANISITITDGTGRLVSTVTDGYLGAGTHNLPFNSTRLAAGVYYCSLKVGNSGATSRMLVIE